MNMKKLLSCFVYAGYAVGYIFACAVGLFARYLPCYKDLWLVSERKTDARDNGLHFFKYMCNNHPEINCAFIITEKSPDYQKVKNLGRVIKPHTFSHMLAFACAKVRISTHYMGCAPDSYRFAVMNRIGLVRGKNVLLRHGITANDLKELHYPAARVELMVCSAVPEYEFMKKNYNQPDGVIKRLGLCRYDRLLSPHIEKKQILIMPTWRYFLRNLSDEEFKKSDYFKNFYDILNSDRLQKKLNEHGYDIILYLHYELQKYSKLFEVDKPNIKTASLESADVQQLLMESSLLITDYSSIFFDFAYMSKPLLYLQFDEEKFYATQYARGYFSCRRDGFGPVVKSSDEAVDFVIQKLNDEMKLDEIYQKRAADFFGERSCDHCQKTYEEIRKILKA